MSTAPTIHSTPPAGAEPRPQVIDSGKVGFSDLGASLRELWHSREVVQAFATRAVKVKYKQTAIGLAWVILQPVLAAIVFAIVFGRVAGVSAGGETYLLIALSGTVAWTFFSTAASSSMDSLVDDQHLLRKVYFPREALPLAAVGAALVDLAPGLVVLVVAVLVDGGKVSLSWLTLPVLILLLIAAVTTLGLFFSAVNVFYRDVKHALPFALQLGFFASAVFYPLEILPESWRSIYAVLNPVVAAIDGLRSALLKNALPDVGVTLAAFAWTGILLVLAYFMFKRLERSFTDRV